MNRFNYEKPLSLRLQRILKEMRERSQNFLSSNDQIKASSKANKSNRANCGSILSFVFLFISSAKKNSSSTVELDDYPSDPDLEYSDYAYEDSLDDPTTTTTTTTKTTKATTTMKIISRTSTEILSSSLTFDDDLSSKEDTHTVSYYDYEEEDEEEAELIDKNEQITTTTTVQTSTTTITTTTITTIRWRIPNYHRRRPIIWNITIEKEYSSISSSPWSSTSLMNVLVCLIIIQIKS